MAVSSDGGSALKRVIQGSVGGGMQEPSVYYALSSIPCLAAGCISYLLDFTGPNNACDTACSSSLVPLHAAISSLEGKSCNVVLNVDVN